MSSSRGRSSQQAQEGTPETSKGRSRSRSFSLPTTPSPTTVRQTSFDRATRNRKSFDSHLVAPDARSSMQLEERNGSTGAGLSKWEAAIGNLEDARVAFDVLARAVDDAVYLDEDAYSHVAPTAQYTKVIQAQHRRIAQLEVQLQDLRLHLEESNSIQTEALQRHAEMQQELENNAVVFKMHYQELLAKDDEIQKLTTVIQALSTR